MGRVSNPQRTAHPCSSPRSSSLDSRYLQWDLCWVIYHHHAAHDWGSIVHHGMFTVMTHYVLHGWFFKKP